MSFFNQAISDAFYPFQRCVRLSVQIGYRIIDALMYNITCITWHNFHYNVINQHIRRLHSLMARNTSPWFPAISSYLTLLWRMQRNLQTKSTRSVMKTTTLIKVNFSTSTADFIHSLKAHHDEIVFWTKVDFQPFCEINIIENNIVYSVLIFIYIQLQHDAVHPTNVSLLTK